MSQQLQVLRNFDTITSAGTHLRLLCLTGALKGTSFVLKSDRVTIGRGEECTIHIDDPDLSREHAELKKVGNDFYLTDLGSQNGCYVNQQRVQQRVLSDKDKVSFGRNIFVFQVIHNPEANKPAPKGRLKLLDGATQVKAEKPKNKLLVPIVVCAIALVFLLPSEEDPKKSRKMDVRVNELGEDKLSFSDKKVIDEDKELKLKLQSMFHRGLREYREGNYYRAIAEFNLALLLSPQNARATFYLNKTKQALDREIDHFFLLAKKDEEALKYKSAIVSYCSIIRILGSYSENERFKDAESRLREIEKTLGMEDREIKCTEE